MKRNVTSRLWQGLVRVKASHFARNVVMVGGGIAAAQAISLAFMPFLTRLYGPEAFGELAAYMALVSIISPLATMGFAGAIVMPESEEGAGAVARLSLVSAALVAVAAFVSVLLFQSRLAVWIGLESIPGLLYLVPATLLLSALLTVADQFAIRQGYFKAKTGSYVASTLLVNVGKLTGGGLAPSGLVLIILSLFASALNFLMLLSFVPRKGVLMVRSWFGVAGIWRAALEQKDFAFYQMPQAVIRAAAMGLPLIVLTSLFGSGAAGQYSITVLLLSAPVFLLGTSFGNVFYPKITRAVQNQSEHAGVLIRKATVVLGLVGVVPFGLIALLGGWLVPLALGAEWARAGEFSQWVAVWMGAMLITRPAVAAMPALGMQAQLLIFEIASTLARIAALYAGFRFGDDLTAVALFAIVNVISYAVILLQVLVRVGKAKGSGTHD